MTIFPEYYSLFPMSFLSSYKIQLNEDIFNDKTLVFEDSGSYGSVFQYVFHHETVALKRLKPFCPSSKEKQVQDQSTFLIELENLVKVNHLCCSSLIGYYISDDPTKGPIIIMPFLKNKSLGDFIKNYQNFQIRYQEVLTSSKNAIDPHKKAEIEEELIFYNTVLAKTFYGVACGLGHIHSLNIVHRDIKPENILFNENYIPVIVDFGFSINTSIKPEISKGSLAFMAPEALQSKDPKKESDVFSFGMTIYEIFANNPFYQDPRHNNFEIYYGNMRAYNGMQLLKYRKQYTLPKMPDDIPDKLWNVIVQCLNPNIDERISIDVLIETFKDPSQFFGDKYDKEDFQYCVEKIKLEESQKALPKKRRHCFTHVDPPEQT